MRFVKAMRNSIFAAAIVGMAATPALACTGITLTASDGSVVYGRTLEWGAFDMNSRVMIAPRGFAFSSIMEDGAPGMTWEAKYGFVAIDCKISRPCGAAITPARKRLLARRRK